MKIVTVDIIIRADIKEVWNFFTDVRHLEIVCPPEINENVIMSTHEKFEKGTELWTETDYLGNRVWHSKITKFQKYEYVDEIKEGIFNKWIHTHSFEKISDRETRIIESVEFDLFHGIPGKILEYFLSKKIKSFLKHRTKTSKNILEYMYNR